MDLGYGGQLQIGQQVEVLYDPTPQWSGIRFWRKLSFVDVARTQTPEPSTIPGSLTPVPETRSNWAGNVTFVAKSVLTPASVGELKTFVAASKRIKPFGTRHSFNTVADTEGEHLSLNALNRILSIDSEERTVTIEPGVTYGMLCPMLDAAGFALPNLASLPHISVVGACATATHGSGVGNKTLSCSVKLLDIVNAEGEAITLRRSDPEFQGAVVALGALGVVTRATLDILPRYEIAQTVYEGLPLTDLKAHFTEVMSAGYSVSLFYDWQTEAINQVWVKRLASDFGSVMRLYGARSATGPRHPLAGISADNCTDQLGVPGPWFQRLPHFKLDFTPSNGVELQSEYFVPFDRGFEAMEAVRALRDQMKPILQISEIRSVASDDFWLSPMYRRSSLGIHFTWHQDWDGVRSMLPVIENALSPFAPRPHWGKLFTMSPELVRAHYENLSEFVSMASSFDPKGKFRNAFLDSNLFSD